MRKKPLIETNPYLKSPVGRQEALLRAAASSTAIEGVSVTRFRELVSKKMGTTLSQNNEASRKSPR